MFFVVVKNNLLPEQVYTMPNTKTLVEELIEEDPQSISVVSFGMDDPAKEALFVSRLTKRKNPLIGNFNGLDIFRVGSIIYSVDENGLAFFVQIEEGKYRIVGIPHSTQIAVWQRSTAPASGLARYVFWNFIFPVHETVITDEKQTADGRRFWESRVGDAFRSGLNVYATNLRTMKISKVNGIKEFNQAKVQLYGPNPVYKLYRLVITSKEIPSNAEFIDL